MLTVLGWLVVSLDFRSRTTEGRERAKERGVNLGRKPKLTLHQWREAIKRRDAGEEMLVEIGRSYNVSGCTIARIPFSS